MDIDLAHGVSTFDVAAIFRFQKDQEAEPRFDMPVPAPQMSSYVLGSWFIEHLRDRTIQALLDGERVINLDLHQRLAGMIAFHLRNRGHFAHSHRMQTLVAWACDEQPHEVDLHRDAFVDPIDLARQCRLAGDPDELIPLIVAETVIDRIMSRIEQAIAGGAAALHILLPGGLGHWARLYRDQVLTL